MQMRLPVFCALVALVGAFDAAFEYKHRYACGVCHAVVEEFESSGTDTCDKYGACDALGARAAELAQTGCVARPL